MATHPAPNTQHRGNRLRPLIWGGAALLLLLPAIAMPFTPEVNWTGSDFAVMGFMLAGTCGLYELATWLSSNTAYRAASGMAVVTGLMTIWANLAVGMFGSEHNPLNLMFGGVLLVPISGALLTTFRARGMALTMAATATAQVLAAAIGLVVGLTVGMDEPHGPGIARETFLTACFAVPWIVSAQLFRRALNDQAASRRAP
ncbi:hypothetical protein [Lysobacter tyrosinilyticus]